MARAVMRLYPGVGLAFGPTRGHGFYYDFDLESPISEEDFPKIEAEMMSPSADSLMITELKRRKLRLKDEIVRLQAKEAA